MIGVVDLVLLYLRHPVRTDIAEFLQGPKYFLIGSSVYNTVFIEQKHTPAKSRIIVPSAVFVRAGLIPQISIEDPPLRHMLTDLTKRIRRRIIVSYIDMLLHIQKHFFKRRILLQYRHTFHPFGMHCVLP